MTSDEFLSIERAAEVGGDHRRRRDRVRVRLAAGRPRHQGHDPRGAAEDPPRPRQGPHQGHREVVQGPGHRDPHRRDGQGPHAHGDGGTTVHAASGESLDVDVVVVSIGRQPQHRRPRARRHRASRSTTAASSRSTSACRTGEPGVWAVGDVHRHPGPRPHRLHRGHHRHPGHPRRGPGAGRLRQGAVGVYCRPEAAFAGLSEEAAKEAGFDVVTQKSRFNHNGRAHDRQPARGHGEGDRREGRRRHRPAASSASTWSGPWVTEQLGQGYLAVNWEATVDDMAHLIQPHPTMTEVLGEAMLSLTGAPSTAEHADRRRRASTEPWPTSRCPSSVRPSPRARSRSGSRRSATPSPRTSRSSRSPPTRSTPRCPSPVTGTLTEIKVPEGETVDVGVVLAVIGDGAGAAARRRRGRAARRAGRPRPGRAGRRRGPPRPPAPAEAGCPAPATGAEPAARGPRRRAAGARRPHRPPAPAAPAAGNGGGADGRPALAGRAPADRRARPRPGADHRHRRRRPHHPQRRLGAAIDRVAARPRRRAGSRRAGPGRRPPRRPGGRRSGRAGGAGRRRAAPPAPRRRRPRHRDTVIPHTNIRKRTAEHMRRSLDTSAHVYAVDRGRLRGRRAGAPRPQGRWQGRGGLRPHLPAVRLPGRRRRHPRVPRGERHVHRRRAGRAQLPEPRRSPSTSTSRA